MKKRFTTATSSAFSLQMLFSHAPLDHRRALLLTLIRKDKKRVPVGRFFQFSIIKVNSPVKTHILAMGWSLVN
ncbi:hypothetical protein L6164_032666 [Bauhinia variegata]|uniref:Uncharacterized protein n=1 Tax=Bauhinia variegata TaxID=167791 RepID=A0ACB9KPD4_BAUVA|nr:hypothetical protein L6164_032666 [Bauhinia variegata]